MLFELTHCKQMKNVFRKYIVHEKANYYKIHPGGNLGNNEEILSHLGHNLLKETYNIMEQG